MMQHEDWYIEGCVKASPEEIALFNEWTGHLPKREDATPYHSGPHSIKHFRHALAIAGLDHRGFRVLEVGFCLGHSAAIFFNLGAQHVTSVEISERPQTIQAKQIIESWRKDFKFVKPGFIPDKRYDFGFIDGDHSYDAIRADLSTMREFGIEWVLMDDFWAHWGDTQNVMKDLSITPVAILGTMALCHFPA